MRLYSIIHGILPLKWWNLTINSFQNPVFHSIVGSLPVKLYKRFWGQVEEYESREWLNFVSLLEIVILWAVNLCKNNLRSIPLFEVINYLVPLSLKCIAPMTLLHVEIQHNKLVRLWFHQLFELFGGVNHQAFRIFPPVAWVCSNLCWEAQYCGKEP